MKSLALLGLVCAIAGCRPSTSSSQGPAESQEAAAPQPASPAPEMGDQPGVPGTWRFETQETEQAFRMLDTCIRKNTPVSQGYVHLPYKPLGNFYEARWCRGSDASDCRIADATASSRNQIVLHLSTLFYPNKLSDVFGLSFHLIQVPKSEGWGVALSLSEGGRSIVGEGGDLTFSHYEKATSDPTHRLSLGTSYSHKIHDDTVQVFSSLRPHEEMWLYLRSSDSMRQRARDQLELLGVKAEEAIRSGKVHTCDYGPYLGDGIPPVCNRRGLTAQEQEAALSELKGAIAQRLKLVQDFGPAMHQALMRAFPFEQCWPWRD